MNNTTGWYWFQDGSVEWFYGMSKQERKVQEMKHGKIIRFKPTK